MKFDWPHYLTQVWRAGDVWPLSVTIDMKKVAPECEVCWELMFCPQGKRTSKTVLNFQYSFLTWLEDMPEDEIPLALANGGLSSMSPQWAHLWEFLAVPYLTSRLSGALEPK